MSQIDAVARRILTEVHRRTQDLACRGRPPAYCPEARAAYDAQTEHGPAWSPTAWFNGPTAAERVRLSRAIAALETAGLVAVVRGAGDRVKHLALTPEGEQAATELTAAAVVSA